MLRASITIIALIFTFHSPVSSDEWLVAPSLWSRNLVDDNRRMREDPGPGLLASLNEVALVSSYRAQTYAVNLHPRFRITRYTEEPSLAAEDYFFSIETSKRLERQQITFAFDFQREGTATTELLDSGRFDTNTARTTLAAETAVNHDFSAAASAGVFGSYHNVAFKDVSGSSFSDYTMGRAGIRGSYQMTERTTWFGDASLSRFSTPADGGKTTSYAFNVGFNTAFTPSVTASLSVGHNFSRIQFVTEVLIVVRTTPPLIMTQRINQLENASGQIIAAHVEKQFSRGVLDIEWTRFFSPSSQGSRQKRQEVNAIASYDINHEWRATSEINYRQQRQEGTALSRISSLDVLVARAGVTHHFDREIDVTFGYRFRTQLDVVREVRSFSNEILLELRYRPLPLLLKR